ncbi:MAG: dephospho-CoA kinase [Candidatus Cloacimonetes bacterium]|nr:dephospho-CoA kinase [Candidatus Cloacimonadota bacterium]
MKPDHRPYLIAITGGIASGKTEVSKIFQKNNFTVYFADKIGHNVLEQRKIIDMLVKNFGKEICLNGKIVRSILGEIVFNSSSRMMILNNILHPSIYKKMDEIIEKSKEKFLVFEIPLLFENNLQKSFDLTINVVSDCENQLRRQLLRDEISLKKAEKKMESQMASTEKRKLADINIENNGKISNLKIMIEKVIKKIPNLPSKQVVELQKVGKKE